MGKPGIANPRQGRIGHRARLPVSELHVAAADCMEAELTELGHLRNRLHTLSTEQAAAAPAAVAETGPRKQTPAVIAIT